MNARSRSAASVLLAVCLLPALLAGCDNTKSTGSPLAGTVAAAPAPAPPPNPLLPYQWYLVNDGGSDAQAFASGPIAAGQDINFAGTTLTGKGVKVAVVDEGLEIAHEDLKDNVVPGGSRNYVNGSTDPTNPGTTGDHGTSVAGIIGMRMDNGIGGRGVAGMASLVGFNLLQSQSAASVLEALGGASYSGDVAVFNQSYGFENFFVIQAASTTVAQYLYGVTSLRGGKGALYVKSAGNGFAGNSVTDNNGTYLYSWTCAYTNLTCQNANMDPYNTLPYQVVLGAVNARGVKSSYSTAGSALWVSAPGGEFGGNSDTITCSGGACAPAVYEPAMVTTDQSGCDKGYAVSTFNGHSTLNQFNLGKVASNSACNYTATFNGTSSAAPVTSGVVALLLEANPNLTWRDVKHVLAKTATQVDASIAQVSRTFTGGTYVAEPGWIINGAGYHFHNWYGFGRVNVSAAVALATGYSSGWPTLTETPFIAGTVATSTIADFSVNGAVGTVALSGRPAFIEAVQIQVNVTHAYPGDLGIELISTASGTRSVLMNVGNGFNTPATATSSAPVANLPNMVLLSNAFYGESANTTWTLKVVDGVTGHTGTQTLNSWSIRIFGH